MSVRVVIIPDGVFQELADELRNVPGRVLSDLTQRGRAWGRRTIADVDQQPGGPRYPIDWQTERQRVAFFATNGFGAGIPYARTGNLNAAWEYTAQRRDALIMRVANEADYATYVIGDDQQRMHKATGWQYVPPILEQHGEQFAEEIIDAFFILGDPTEKVFR